MDTKGAESKMILDQIERVAQTQSLMMDRLSIRNGSEGLPPTLEYDTVISCVNCSSEDHREDNCPVMAIQNPNYTRPSPYVGQGQPSRMNNPTYQPAHSSGGYQRNQEHYQYSKGHMIRPNQPLPHQQRTIAPAQQFPYPSAVASPHIAPSDPTQLLLAQILEQMKEMSQENKEMRSRIERMEKAKPMPLRTPGNRTTA